MKVINLNKPTDTDKYRKALSRQLGRELSDSQLHKAALYDSLLYQIQFEIVAGGDKKVTFESLLVILAKLLAQTAVAGDVAGLNINFSKVHKFLEQQYDEALKNYLEGDFTIDTSE